MLKRILESTAARSGLAAALARRTAPATVILGYHDIVPRGEPVAGDVALHVRQESFGDQLDLLLETHDVVALDEVRFGEGVPGRPRAVITFDDAYVGTLTAGFEELARRGLPATVFVPPGLLGEEGFWWDHLAPPGGRPLDPRLRARAHGPELRGRQTPILAWAREEGLPVADLPEYARPATADDLVTRVGAASGITVGAHTWGHPNLAVLPPDEVVEEFRRCHAWLHGSGMDVTDWLAYPYGLYDDAVAAVADAHFCGAVLVEGGIAEIRGGWHGDAARVPRLQIPSGLSVEGLALRLAGVLRGYLAGTSTS